MGSTSENLCLQWHDFESNVTGAFLDLRSDGDFFDVTLGCADSPRGQSIQAHKVILSASSSTFKQMLRDQARLPSSNPHPYIFLRGVSYLDLCAVVDFIYRGEVSVAQEQLNSFLAVAEDLQIKGLTQKKGDIAQAMKKSRSPRADSSEDTTTMPAKRPRTSDHEASEKSHNPRDRERMNIKIDPEEGPSGLQSVTCHVDVPNYPGDQEAEAGGEYDEDYGDYFGESEAAAVGDERVMDDILSPSQQATNSESGMRKVRKDCKMPFASPVNTLTPEETEMVLAKMRKLDGQTKWYCLECPFIGRDKGNTKQHIISRHMPHKDIPCPSCQKKFKNGGSLRRHLLNSPVCKNESIMRYE